MRKIKLTYHAGSENHGCEAIVRGTYNILKDLDICMVLYSNSPSADYKYKLNKICEIKEFINGLRSETYLKRFIRVLRRQLGLNIYNKELTQNKNCDIFFSIGGDNYSTYRTSLGLAKLHNIMNKTKHIGVLWGCSIEEKLLDNKNVVDDLKNYSLIVTRESITHNMLIKKGIKENIKMYPDPAFTLEKCELDLPPNFIEGKTIGINISPLIQKNEQKEGIAYENYKNLISYIIEETDNNIALIPHVVINNNNDLEPLMKLYNEFKGKNRVVLISDCNCMELKGYISRLKMFIGARTHATIAAYSTCVPTLVVGYSVKAKGIAKDIFESYENYVIPVQSFEKGDDLINAFEWLKDNEDSIRKHLVEFMPVYIDKAFKARDEIKKLMDS